MNAYISNTGVKIDPSVINLDKPRHARKLDEGHEEKVEEVEFDFDGESTFKCEAEDSDDALGNSDADWFKPVDESTAKTYGVDEDFKQQVRKQYVSNWAGPGRTHLLGRKRGRVGPTKHYIILLTALKLATLQNLVILVAIQFVPVSIRGFCLAADDSVEAIFFDRGSELY